MINETSLLAYTQILKELGDRQQAVFLAILELGEANNLMISKKLNLPINSITPRVLELRKKELVAIAKIDFCPYTKRLTNFWRIERNK